MLHLLPLFCLLYYILLSNILIKKNPNQIMSPKLIKPPDFKSLPSVRRGFVLLSCSSSTWLFMSHVSLKLFDLCSHHIFCPAFALKKCFGHGNILLVLFLQILNTLTAFFKCHVFHRSPHRRNCWNDSHWYYLNRIWSCNVPMEKK